ncbi:dihydrofolate reductase [bacterium]|nr:MAG: dihydrofolate reductase [bacterium]
MRRLVTWNVMTLDGNFEGAQPWNLDHHGSIWGDELERFSIEQLGEVGTLLFGRRTYQGMADYWKEETGEVAELMNAVPKAVATRTLETADWNNTRVLKGEAVETVRALKEEDGKDVYVFGSAELLESLDAAGLVDEHRICLAPVTIGAGNPLFKPSGRPLHLNLLEARPLTNGGLILRYAPRTEA